MILVAAKARTRGSVTPSAGFSVTPAIQQKAECARGSFDTYQLSSGPRGEPFTSAT